MNQGKRITTDNPTGTRMYNRVNVPSGIANLFEVISRNSITAKQVARYAIKIGTTFLRFSSPQNWPRILDLPDTGFGYYWFVNIKVAYL